MATSGLILPSVRQKAAPKEALRKGWFQGPQRRGTDHLAIDPLGALYGRLVAEEVEIALALRHHEAAREGYLEIGAEVAFELRPERDGVALERQCPGCGACDPGRPGAVVEAQELGVEAPGISSRGERVRLRPFDDKDVAAGPSQEQRRRQARDAGADHHHLGLARRAGQGVVRALGRQQAAPVPAPFGPLDRQSRERHGPQWHLRAKPVRSSAP